MNIQGVNAQFNNLNRINVLLGKNGVGKSTLLKGLANDGRPDKNASYIEYITPERGGVLTFEAHVEQNMAQGPQWVNNTRLVNQHREFKQQTLVRYQNLETKILRLIEQAAIQREQGNPVAFTFFEGYIAKINSLLENIEIRRNNAGKGFKVFKKEPQNEINTQTISSGESELIGLAIECLFFQINDVGDKPKILLLDEPDVHIHPDLQIKFMQFIYSLATEAGKEFTVILATHSTAFLGALENTADISICFASAGTTVLDFHPITEAYKKFLPMFGAHPLSNLFNQAPVLLVEGEDDERIWQQAVRTSQGKIKVYPCVCGSIGEIIAYETEVAGVINSVYDNAKAYSLRDRDDVPNQDLPDHPPIIRHRLQCYSMENLLLTNEVLHTLGKTWDEVKHLIDEWIAEKTDKQHPQLDAMIAFREGGYDRRNTKIKALRVLLVGLMGSNKPWEVIVGQVLANIRWNADTDYTADGSIFTYMGKKLVESLLLPA